MTKHALFSPSASDGWLNCFGRVELCKKAPPQRTSPAALEGTKAHECLEFITKRYSNVKKAYSAALNSYPKHMVDCALDSVELIYSLKPADDAQLLIESKVTLTKECHGTVDYAWLDLWGHLVVLDYKFGYGYVSAEDNSQLLIYALSLAKKYHYDFDKVTVGIIQPRVESADGILRTKEVKIKELKEFEKKVLYAIEQGKKPGAPLVAGDHCRWCPALPICPENSKKALENAELHFDIEDGLVAAPEVNALTPENLSKILPAISQIEAWTKSVREYAYDLAKRQKIPGYKLVPNRPSRVWNKDAENLASARFGEDAYETEKRFLSPAQFEKKIGIMGKKFVAEHASSVSSGTVLVPESDKRPEINQGVDFD